MMKLRFVVAGALTFIAVPVIAGGLPQQGTPECDAAATKYANERATPGSSFWFDDYNYYESQICVL